MNGLVADFTFAARPGPRGTASTLFICPPIRMSPIPGLMFKAEGNVPDWQNRPSDRTHALNDGPGGSRHAIARSGQKRLETPHLAIRYQVPQRRNIADVTS